MKIFAIGRNYSEHAKELGNAVPDEPVVFLKPQSALLKADMPFDMPSFSNQIEYEAELVIKICRNGKNIPMDKATEYYKEISIGIDFTARDIQKKLKEKGLPWELAKAFDHSAAVGTFLHIKTIRDLNNINFHLNQNQKTVQSGSSKDMMFNFDHIVCYISKYFTLNIGDMIFTGTPHGVGKVSDNDIYEGFIEGKKLLTCEIKNNTKSQEKKKKKKSSI